MNNYEYGTNEVTEDIVYFMGSGADTADTTDAADTTDTDTI